MHTSMNVKQTAHQLIDSLPENATWDKLLYTLQVRRDIEAGIAEVEEGNVLSSEEIRNFSPLGE